MARDLVDLLAEGKTYLWALRHATEDGAARSALADAGVDLQTLLALKQLEPSIARLPYPAAKKPDHRYLEIPLPPERTIFFAPLVTEHGVEVGLEILPDASTWTFAHREIQYVLGGDVRVDAVLPNGTIEAKTARAGDVLALPAGLERRFHRSQNTYEHAHLFLVCLGESEPQVFYDAVALRRLQPDAKVRDDVAHRIEIQDWAELLAPRPGRSEHPTWLRNGWAHREATRALDYREGTRSLVIGAPDREPENYVEWGEAESRCWVNPIVAEHTCAVTDCRLPAGYARSQPFKEVWTVLRGEARIRMTLAPLHSQSVEHAVDGGTVLVVPGGARVFVDDASSEFVVRRLAESCAQNGHWAMMERKLVVDGVDRDYC